MISVPDESVGEVPKAFVVRSSLEDSEDNITLRILDHVKQSKARYKWITGGVEYVQAIPKSPTGKILRRLLRDREREKRRRKLEARI